MKKILFINLLLVILLCNCNFSKNQKIKNLDELNWLLGEWEQRSKESLFVEKWSKTNDNKFSGNSYMIQNNDTVFTEQISLEISNNELQYKTNVNNQNNLETICFTLISNKNKEYVFENKLHDFPQRIVYKKNGKDSLNAYIEGKVEGVYKKEEFNMKRISGK